MKFWSAPIRVRITSENSDVRIGAESAQNRSRFGADSAPNDVRPMFARIGADSVVRIGSDFTQKVVRPMFVRIGHDSVVLRGANSVVRTYPESDPIRSSEYGPILLRRSYDRSPSESVPNRSSE